MNRLIAHHVFILVWLLTVFGLGKACGSPVPLPEEPVFDSLRNAKHIVIARPEGSAGKNDSLVKFRMLRRLHGKEISNVFYVQSSNEISRIPYREAFILLLQGSKRDDEGNKVYVACKDIGFGFSRFSAKQFTIEPAGLHKDSTQYVWAGNFYASGLQGFKIRKRIEAAGLVILPPEVRCYRLSDFEALLKRVGKNYPKWLYEEYKWLNRQAEQGKITLGNVEHAIILAKHCQKTANKLMLYRFLLVAGKMQSLGAEGYSFPYRGSSFKEFIVEYCCESSLPERNEEIWARYGFFPKSLEQALSNPDDSNPTELNLRQYLSLWQIGNARVQAKDYAGAIAPFLLSVGSGAVEHQGIIDAAHCQLLSGKPERAVKILSSISYEDLNLPFSSYWLDVQEGILLQLCTQKRPSLRFPKQLKRAKRALRKLAVCSAIPSFADRIKEISFRYLIFSNYKAAMMLLEQAKEVLTTINCKVQLADLQKVVREVKSIGKDSFELKCRCRTLDVLEDYDEYSFCPACALYKPFSTGFAGRYLWSEDLVVDK